MDYFSITDYILFGVYLATLIAMGLLLKNKASGSLEDYFLGGRRLPWWLLGFSGMASWISLTGSMVIVAFLFMIGPRGIYVEFRGGVGLILIIMMLWTGKWHRRSDCMTGAEYMKFRFGEDIGGQSTRLISVAAGLLGTVGVLGLVIKGLGIFLAMFLPWSPLQCSMVFVGIVTFYTIFSGFYGVVVTDVFQSLLICVGAVGVCIVASRLIGNCDDFPALAQAVSGNSDWMRSMPCWETKLFPGYETYQKLIIYASFALCNNMLLGSSAGGDPKYFAARNDKECGKLSMLWGFFLAVRWPLMISFAVIGLFLVQDFFPDQNSIRLAVSAIRDTIPDITAVRWTDVINDVALNPASYPELVARLSEILGENWAEKVTMLSFHGTINPETIMPAVLRYNIPGGFRGVILIAMIAASMSTFDSIVNGCAGLFTRDLYQNIIRPKASNRELIYASYVFIFILVVLGFLFAYTIESINQIWGFIVMGLNAGLMVPAILKLYWWRFNAAGFVVGTAVGFILATLQWIFLRGMDERLQFVSLFGITLICTVVVTLFTRPTDKHILDNFYLKTRPFGFWKPFKVRLVSQSRLDMFKEHRGDLLSLPFGLIWLVTMFLVLMQLIIRTYDALFWTLPILTASSLALYFLWYRNLDKMDYGMKFVDE